MGYRISATGLIELDPHSTEEQVKVAEDQLRYGHCFSDAYRLPGGRVFSVTISDDQNYWDDDVKDALTELTDAFPIINAEIDYTGDDGEAWRHIFRGGQWLEQNGYIVYEEPGTPFPRVDTEGGL